MSQTLHLDEVLVTWGDRLFYPGNRIVKVSPAPKLRESSVQRRAAAMRKRIEATVVRRAPQVMVKVTGGGRSIKAIAAHFRYISKNGRLEIEDQRGETARGRDAMHDLAEEWRLGGSLIPDDAEPRQRREALNIMLSMPRGTDPLSVQWAARDFAKAELAGHTWVMVLHDHQANPHVHISVRVESRDGRRLNPRKADLHRWREIFAEKLRERGIEAEATRQATRGVARNHPDLWRIKAAEQRRILRPRVAERAGSAVRQSRAEARAAWGHIAAALAASGNASDRRLAESVRRYTGTVDRGPEPSQQVGMRGGPSPDLAGTRTR